MSSRFKVVQTEHLSPGAAAWLNERCELIKAPNHGPELLREIADADAMVVRTYTRVDQGMLQAAPRLKVVGRAGVGVDNIDLAACYARGVQVVYTPDANTQAVVEYVLCLVGDALRPRVVLSRAVDPKEWDQLRQEIVGRRQMSDLTLGILGLGRIGRRVAEVAHAIGFDVLFNDLVPPDPACDFAQSVKVEELFSRSDVLTVHIDGRSGNRHFVSRALIDRMKADVVFINTSRGFVVDAPSLAAFLGGNPGALAMLDVHDPEPFGPDYPLLGLPNARLHPHLASRTERALENMSWVVRDVLAVLEGHKPRFPAPVGEPGG